MPTLSDEQKILIYPCTSDLPYAVNFLKLNRIQIKKNRRAAVFFDL